MDLYILRPGDFFAVQGKGFISWAINFFQRFWSKDNESIYSHAGIILDANGTTMEALEKGTLESQNLFEAYKGREVLIARYDHLTPALHRAGLEALKEEFEGEGYPFYRLLLHIFPPLAKLHFLGRGVCSEVVAYYLWQVGARGQQWAGVNPDTLADEWVRWRDFTVVYQGLT